MTRTQRLALTAVIFGLFAACAGEPIPKRVLAGTTFVMPFVVQTLAYSVDPGASPGTILTLPDPQRGRSRFALCQNGCAQRVDLITRYVGAMAPDRGSRTGISAVGELIPAMGGNAIPLESFLIPQPVLIADVPVTAAGGMYASPRQQVPRQRSKDFGSSSAFTASTT